jgi:uncharacterized lipoprotein NlpE involved in copper resistance
MKHLTITALLIAVATLSGCDDKQERIDFYMKHENTSDYTKGLSKCKAGASDSKDCEAIYEVERMKKKDSSDDKKQDFKKKFSFDH